MGAYLMDSSWTTSWGTSWAETWGGATVPSVDAIEPPGLISEAFAYDQSGMHLLPNEIAQRRRLWLMRQRDKDIEAKEKRRRRELELLALYALVKKAA